MTGLKCQTKRWLSWSLYALVLWLLFLAPATASASGTPPQKVTVEMAELDRLDNIFSQQQQINGKLLNKLTDSRTELAKSQAALKKAQQELMQLRLQITALKSLSESQENLLQKANESFKEYAAEQKRTRLRIKAQRNTWEAVACLAIIGCFIK